MFSCFHGIEVESDIEILSFYLQIAFDRKAEAQYSVMDQVGAFSCVNLRIFMCAFAFDILYLGFYS